MIESSSKGRLLFLEHYLLEHTDDTHQVTAEDLMNVYEENGYKANRSTIRDDISILQSSGIDVIIDQKGKFKTFYIGNRLFEPAELKTLADAVASSRFITKEKSEALIKKLTELTSINNRSRLLNNAFSANRIKTVSRGVFHSVDTITEAIENGRKISFKYIDYLPTKKEILRHNGKTYTVSPYALLWNDDRYYVPSYSEEKECIIPFRVDRMRNVRIVDEAAVRNDNFDASEYSRKVLLMFDGDEEECEITLIAENKYMLNIIDRFGEDVQTSIVDDEHFKAKVTVRPSSTFFSWVFQFRGGVCISAPESVVKSYSALLSQVAAAQNNLTDR